MSLSFFYCPVILPSDAAWFNCSVTLAGSIAPFNCPKLPREIASLKGAQGVMARA